MPTVDTIIADYGIPALWALIILIVGRIVARMITSGVRKMMNKNDVDGTLVKFGSNTTATWLKLLSSI